MGQGGGGGSAEVCLFFQESNILSSVLGVGRGRRQEHQLGNLK